MCRPGRLRWSGTKQSWPRSSRQGIRRDMHTWFSPSCSQRCHTHLCARICLCRLFSWHSKPPVLLLCVRPDQTAALWVRPLSQEQACPRDGPLCRETFRKDPKGATQQPGSHRNSAFQERAFWRMGR